MPQLARLSDPHYLASLATDLDPAAGGRGPARGRAAPGDPGPLPARAAPRPLRPGDTGSRSGFFAKTDKDTSPRTGDRGGYPPRPAAGEAVPTRDRGRARGLLPAGLRRAVAEAGAPLSRLLAVRAGEAAAYVALVGGQRGCCTTRRAPPRALHRRPPARPRPRLRGPLDPRGEHVRALLPEVGRQFDDVAAGVVRALEGSRATRRASSTETSSPTTSSSTTAESGCSTWTVCLGDAALDLGKLLADLRWCAGSEPRQRLQAALRDGYGPDTDDRWARPVCSPPCSR